MIWRRIYGNPISIPINQHRVCCLQESRTHHLHVQGCIRVPGKKGHTQNVRDIRNSGLRNRKLESTQPWDFLFWLGLRHILDSTILLITSITRILPCNRFFGWLVYTRIHTYIHYITLHYVTLHYITKPYKTLHYTT